MPDHNFMTGTITDCTSDDVVCNNRTLIVMNMSLIIAVVVVRYVFLKTYLTILTAISI